MSLNFVSIILLTNFFCLTLQSDCQKDSNLNGIAKISEWWSKMSIPKIVNCNTSQFHKKGVDDSVWTIFENIKHVSSAPCGDNEMSISFETRGRELKVIDGRLEGTGKLIITKSWTEDTPEEVKNSTCLTLRVDGQGNTPKEIIGTFKNGILEGNARITFTNNAIILSKFQNGLLHGFGREWKPDGELHQMGNFYRNVLVSHCWKSLSGRLIYEDCSLVQHPEEPLALVLALNKSEDFLLLGGRLDPISFHLENISDVSLTHVSSVDDCVLEIRFDQTERKNFSYDITAGKRIEMVDKENTSLCQLETDGNQNGSMILRDWLNSVLDEALTQPYNLLNKMKPVTQDVSKEEALVLIPEVKLADGPNKTRKLNISILNGKPTTFSLTVISLDADNRCHGYCELRLDSSGNLEDVGSDPTLGWKPIKIIGEFKHGILNGHCTVGFVGERLLFGTAKDGVLHGPLVIYGISNILPGRKLLKEKIDHQGIGFLGTYVNGRATGHFWIGMKGGGHLHGKTDDRNGSVTGDRIAYIYPDKETVLFGTFENRILKSGQESTVLEVGCNDQGFLTVTKFAEPSGPFFYYEPPTNISWGSGPPGVREPYERKWLEVRQSQIPNSGEGIFLRRDASAKQVISFMSGFYYDEPDETKLYNENCVENISKSDEYRRACKKYSIGIQSYHTTVNIPPEFDGPGLFFPALGQKVNHHFRLNNTAFSEAEHPRWGPMPCVITTVPIKAGQEAFAFYGYFEAPFPSDFPWYWETKISIEREERLQRENEKQSIKKKRKTKKSELKKKP